MDYFSKVFVLVTLWMNLLAAAPRKPRLSLAAQNPSYYYSDIDGIAGTYSFGYDVLDSVTGNSQFRTEERYPNGTVVGSYGYIDPRGRSRRFDYIADENGYRVVNEAPTSEMYVQPTVDIIKSTSTEPEVTWTRPKKTNKNKNPVKQPSQLLEPPQFTILE